jgi:hypothetical protein
LFGFIFNPCFRVHSRVSSHPPNVVHDTKI